MEYCDTSNEEKDLFCSILEARTKGIVDDYASKNPTPTWANLSELCCHISAEAFGIICPRLEDVEERFADLEAIGIWGDQVSVDHLSARSIRDIGWRGLAYGLIILEVSDPEFTNRYRNNLKKKRNEKAEYILETIRGWKGPRMAIDSNALCELLWDRFFPDARGEEYQGLGAPWLSPLGFDRLMNEFDRALHERYLAVSSHLAELRLLEGTEQRRIRSLEDQQSYVDTYARIIGGNVRPLDSPILADVSNLSSRSSSASRGAPPSMVGTESGFRMAQGAGGWSSKYMASADEAKAKHAAYSKEVHEAETWFSLLRRSRNILRYRRHLMFDNEEHDQRNRYAHIDHLGWTGRRGRAASRMMEEHGYDQSFMMFAAAITEDPLLIDENKPLSIPHATALHIGYSGNGADPQLSQPSLESIVGIEMDIFKYAVNRA